MPDDSSHASRFARLEPTAINAGELRLRVWDETDIPALLQAAADSEIGRWNPVRLPGAPVGHALADAEQARVWIASRQVWDGHAAWAVCDGTDGDLLGYASLHDLQERHLSGEVGYWVLPVARGRGVARRAVSATARFGFSVLGLNRIQLYHAVDNPASCAVASGAGFAVEGLARQAYRYGDGLLHDDHLHARLASDPDPSQT